MVLTGGEVLTGGVKLDQKGKRRGGGGWGGVDLVD